MNNLGKCISCHKKIDDTHIFCIYCGAKQSSHEYKVEEYITYFGGIRVKKTTTTLIGVLAVVMLLVVSSYFFISKMGSVKDIITTVEETKESIYLIKDSDKYPITPDNLKGLTKYELAMARNEILARHGYVYTLEPYKSYFNSKSWYKPNPKFKGQKEDLSPLERHNIKLIMAAEGTKPAANYDSDYHGKT